MPMLDSEIDDFCRECAGGDAKMVSQLLVQMTPFDLRSAFIRIDSALYLAVSNNHIDVCKLLLQQRSEEHRKAVVEGLNSVHPYHRKTVLYVACEHGLEAVAELLFRSGAKLAIDDYDNENSYFPKHCFAIAYLNNHTNICKMILDYNKLQTSDLFAIEGQQNLKQQLLQIACSRGDLEMVNLILLYVDDIFVWGMAKEENPATSQVKLERTVDFRHKVDDNLPLRKLCLASLETLLNTAPDKFDANAIMAISPVLLLTPGDVEEVKLLFIQLLPRLAKHTPGSVAIKVDELIPALEKVLR